MVKRSAILKTSETKENNRVTAIETTGATFQINDAKLYIPVVTLPVNEISNF